MRTGLLASLVVHGAAGAALALWGFVGSAPEPPMRRLFVAMQPDVWAAPEPAPEELPPLAAPPVPVAPWPMPEEAPESPEIEAPAAPGILRDRPFPRVARLARPLGRPAAKEPPAANGAPAPRAAARAAPSPGGVLVEPRRLPDSPDPAYPPRAQRMRLEGTVLLLLRIAADGSVARVAIDVSSGHPLLDRAAEEAAPLWRFAPARRDGVAVASDVRVPVEFRLADA